MKNSRTAAPPFMFIVFAFIAIYIIWGSTYLFNKILVSELPPFFIAGFRFVTASFLVGVYCFITGRRTPLTTTKLINATKAGFLFLVLGNGCMVYALQYVDSGFAALLVAAVPLVVLLLMYFTKGIKIGYMSLFGVVLGIVGVYLLTSQEGISLDGNWLGIVGVVVALLSWSYASIYVGDLDLPTDSLINTGIQMFTGGIIMLIFSLLSEQHMQSLLSYSLDRYLAMGYLIVFGSIIAFTAFNFLLVHISPEKVATSNYVNPIVAMFLGWFYLGEVITAQSIMAGGFLLTGVYFVNSSKGE